MEANTCGSQTSLSLRPTQNFWSEHSRWHRRARAEETRGADLLSRRSGHSLMGTTQLRRGWQRSVLHRGSNSHRGLWAPAVYLPRWSIRHTLRNIQPLRRENRANIAWKRGRRAIHLSWPQSDPGTRSTRRTVPHIFNHQRALVSFRRRQRLVHLLHTSDRLGLNLPVQRQAHRISLNCLSHLGITVHVVVQHMIMPRRSFHWANSGPLSKLGLIGKLRSNTAMVRRLLYDGDNGYAAISQQPENVLDMVATLKRRTRSAAISWTTFLRYSMATDLPDICH